MKQLHYFTNSGDYGDAEGIIIISTADWTEQEWEAIRTAPPREVVRAALAIHKELGQGKQSES